MRISKKLLCVALAFALVFALAGCGESVPASTDGGGSGTPASSEQDLQSTSTSTEKPNSENSGTTDTGAGDGEKWYLIKMGGTEDDPRFTYEYDDDWIRISQTLNNGSTRYVDSYDDTGENIVHRSSYKDDELQYEENYEFDDQGRKVTAIRSNSAGEWVSQVWEYNSDGLYTSTIFSAEGNVLSMTEYDAHNHPLRVENGGTLITYENEYSDAGKIAQITEYGNGELYGVSRYEYSDDDRLQFVYEYTTILGEWFVSQECVYDEHGLRVYNSLTNNNPATGVRVTDMFSEYVNAAGEHVNGYTMDIEPYRIAPHLPE